MVLYLVAEIKLKKNLMLKKEDFKEFKIVFITVGEMSHIMCSFSFKITVPE